MSSVSRTSSENVLSVMFEIKRKVGIECAAKLFKIPLEYMETNEMLGYKRELKILKVADHPFII